MIGDRYSFFHSVFIHLFIYVIIIIIIIIIIIVICSSKTFQTSHFFLRTNNFIQKLITNTVYHQVD